MFSQGKDLQHECNFSCVICRVNNRSRYSREQMALVMQDLTHIFDKKSFNPCVHAIHQH